jgi:hypothetical protein
MLLELSSAQALAVEVLDAGGTHKEAAEVADVDRTTVWRWVNRHPAFVAELNQRRIDRAAASQRRLEAIDDDALAALEEAVRGDPGLALQWFKVRGFAQFSVNLTADALAIVLGKAQALRFDAFDAPSGVGLTRAFDAIWQELCWGFHDPSTRPEVSADDTLLGLTPEALAEWPEEDKRSLVEEVDTDDPEVVDKLKELGLVKDDPERRAETLGERAPECASEGTPHISPDEGAV